MGRSEAQRKADRKYQRKKKQNRKKETPIQRQQRCSIRNEKDWARGPRPIEQEWARCQGAAFRRTRRKDSKRLATVPFSAIPGFKLNRRQRNECRAVQRRIRNGTAYCANFEPALHWYRTFIGEDKGRHMAKETQERREARLSKQRERSARNRAARTIQQKLVCREKDSIRQRLRRGASHYLEDETVRKLETRLAELSPRGNHSWMPETVAQQENRLRQDADSTFRRRSSKRQEGELFKEMAEAKLQLSHVGFAQNKVREEIRENEGRLHQLQIQICSSCLSLVNASSPPSGGIELAKWQREFRYLCSRRILQGMRDRPWRSTCIGRIERIVENLEGCREKLSNLDEQAQAIGRRFPVP